MNLDREVSKHGLDVGIKVVLAILGVIVLFLVSPDNLIINPSFEISIVPSNSSEKIYVINNGWKQADDVEIFIVGNESLSEKSIKYSYCPEGFEILDSKQPMTLKLHVERMSVGLECSIYFSSESLEISKVIVTSDNQPFITKEPPKPSEIVSKISNNISVVIILMVVLFAILSIIRLVISF